MNNFERHKDNIKESIGIGLSTLVEKLGDELINVFQYNPWNRDDRWKAQKWLNEQLPIEVEIKVCVMDNNKGNLIIRKLETHEIIFRKQIK